MKKTLFVIFLTLNAIKTSDKNRKNNCNLVKCKEIKNIFQSNKSNFNKKHKTEPCQDHYTENSIFDEKKTEQQILKIALNKINIHKKLKNNYNEEINLSNNSYLSINSFSSRSFSSKDNKKLNFRKSSI